MKKAENFVGVILILVLIFTLIWVNWQRIEKKTPPKKENPLKGIDPQNPFYTPPLEKKDIPFGAILLEVSQDGFKPDRFEVKKGQKVTLVLSSTDNNFHSLIFEKEELEKVKIIVEPKTTRGIVFFAPENPGEYRFFDLEVQGKEKPKGVMVVK